MVGFCCRRVPAIERVFLCFETAGVVAGLKNQRAKFDPLGAHIMPGSSMAERPTVNRVVTGSSPVLAAKSESGGVGYLGAFGKLRSQVRVLPL